ncbi:MAG: NADH-quinone oxidoreductase subunit K [Phycisphaerales bacterium]|nr:NADH-quinone oxidoreductase subunit K [Phycisphaerales bacterium]
MMQLTLTHYLVMSVLILSAGLITLFLRKSPLGKLMGVELILTAAALNFAAFGAYAQRNGLDGEFFSLLIMLTAAVQTIIAVALIVSYHRAGGRV